MNDLLRRTLLILRADALTLAQRVILWAIQDLAGQEAPYSQDESNERLMHAFFNAVLVGGVEAVEIVWKMRERDAQDTLSILRIGEAIERYAMAEHAGRLLENARTRDGWTNEL